MQYNSDQTSFSNTLTRAVVKTLDFQALVSTPPSGLADVNAYKLCLIPILSDYSYLFYTGVLTDCLASLFGFGLGLVHD